MKAAVLFSLILTNSIFAFAQGEDEILKRLKCQNEAYTATIEIRNMTVEWIVHDVKSNQDQDFMGYLYTDSGLNDLSKFNSTDLGSYISVENNIAGISIQNSIQFLNCQNE